MTKPLLSAVFVVCIIGSVFAGSNNIVRFANDGSHVIVRVDGISSFQGSSSAVYSQSGKTHRMGISDLEMIGPVRNAMAETPFGNASVSEATFGSQDSPFEYSLTLKNMESFKAFTVQAVFHNRSDSDINLAAFDLIDTRKGSGGAFKVANANDWLVTSLMENMSAISLTDASKSMREAAMIYHRNGHGFLVGPVGPAEAYTRVQAVEKAILATVTMDNVLVPAGQSRRSEEMYILSCLGGPERGAIGYVDAARIAMDSHPAHFQGCLSKVLRTQIFHGVWWSANDPDVSYLAEKLTSRNLGPTPEGVGMWRTWHSVVALVGGTAMVSEPLDAPDAKELWRHYSIMRPASAEPAKLLTLGVSRNNEIFGFAAKRPYGDFAVYNLYNSTKEPMDITLDFSQAKLPSGVKCAVFDFWDNRFVGLATDQYSAANVSPFSSKLLRFTPVDRADTGSPILIGSNLHLSMGATEIRNLRVTKSKVIIELDNAGARDGSLTFYSLRPLKALGSKGCSITSVEKKGDNIWQVNVSDRKWAKEQNITLHYSENSYGQAGVNLAPLASVSGPGKDLQAVIDGVKQQDGLGEWIGGGAETWTGRRSSPKGLQLAWQRPQKINKIVLYDRPTLDQHFASLTVRFSDGSKLEICGIPNDGSPKTVVFEPRTITGFTLDGVDGMGLKQGFSEIECYYDPDAHPDEGRKKEYTDWVSYVDPTIETTRGRWFFCTPGSRPFGMVCAAAYTRNSNGGGGGYNYNGEEILGFANIHAWILSGINIMPTTGEVNPNLGEKGWKSKFSHETEIIEPGYHKVFLDRYQTQVEYTSTDRVAFYRMTYKEAAQAQLLLQLGGYVGNVSYVDGHAKWVSPTRLEGFHGMTDRVWNGPKLNHVFFVMEFDRPITQMDGWKGTDEKRLKIKTYANPVTPERLKQDKRKYVIKNLPEEQAGVAMAYDAAEGDVVQVKIGMSYTSIENARKNLEGECPHWDFDRVKKEARAEWNDRLGRIAVKGGEEKTWVKFYTDLWHTQLGRHKIDDLNKEAGRTIQYNFEDWALAQMAADLGKGADVKTFTRRSTGWRTLIHPEIGLAFPKNADGSWMHTDPFTKKGWVESNAWQGTWDASHDIQGLSKRLGGSEQLCQKLNFAFEKSAPGDFYADGMHGYLSYVNQPSCSSAHVFNHAGQPWLSQKWARAVSRQTYGATNPNMGYGGCDEDQGQMGGVSALMKLGLFSLRGTTSREPIYEITSPEFDEVTIQLDPRYYSGKTFTIKAYDNSDKNCYIQKARLNGQPLDNCWFYHKEFAEGGLLELWLGPKPNKQWGNRPE